MNRAALHHELMQMFSDAYSCKDVFANVYRVCGRRRRNTSSRNCYKLKFYIFQSMCRTDNQLRVVGDNIELCYVVPRRVSPYLECEMSLHPDIVRNDWWNPHVLRYFDDEFLVYAEVLERRRHGDALRMNVSKQMAALRSVYLMKTLYCARKLRTALLYILVTMFHRRKRNKTCAHLPRHLVKHVCDYIIWFGRPFSSF